MKSNPKFIVRSAAIALMAAVLLATSSTFAFDTGISRQIGTDFQQISSTKASLTVNFGNVVRNEVWDEGILYDRFPIENQPPAGPIGKPELPLIVKYVIIPPESGFEIDLKVLKSHRLENVNPYPRQPEPIEMAGKISDATLATSLVRDEAFMKTSGFWPETIVDFQEPQIMRGYRILPIAIAPMRYNPATREMIVLDEVEIELNFNTDKNRVNLVDNSIAPRPSRNIDLMLRRLVVNPPPVSELDYARKGGSILYVTGSGQNWDQVVTALNPLIEWRRKMGWTVNLLRPQNFGSYETVKQAIQQVYNTAEIPPEYIVIVGDGNGSWIMPYYNSNVSGLGYPYESDNTYGLLEGGQNDMLPDAAVSRIPFDSMNRLTAVINKTIRYESDPFIGEGNARGWQKRAAVESPEARSGRSPEDMCRWTKAVLLKDADYDVVNELYHNGGNANNLDFVNNNFTAGISFFVHRGYLWMNPSYPFAGPGGLRNGRMLGYALIITCNTGDFGEAISDGGNGYHNESFIWNELGGAIAAVGCAGATHTAYNNIYCTSNIDGLFALGLQSVGWAHTNGKMGLISHYMGRGDINHEENRNMEAWLTEVNINNLMGDGAVDLFTDIPRALSVNKPEAIRKGETFVDVTVTYDDNDEPARDATVCLYKTGAFQLVGKPDEAGRVRFALDPAWTARDSVHLTITGHNLMTNRSSYVIGQADNFLAAATFVIDDDGDGASQGNGDEIANQTETLELTVRVKNQGRNVPQGQIALALTTDDQNLEVIEGQGALNQAPAAGDSVDVDFLVRIGEAFPSGQTAAFKLVATSGNTSWTSGIAIPVRGPKMQVARIRWQGPALSRADDAEFQLFLRNTGTTPIPDFNATLLSDIFSITPVNAEAQFEGAAVRDTVGSAQLFRVSSHPYHLGGHPGKMRLAIEADGGYIDTIAFDLPVTPPPPTDPIGPDEYGYICFNNTDTSWFAVPVFNWVEIDPRRDGEGTNTGLTDQTEEDDESMMVELPFNFQYYGEDFDRITICSNGWIAPGDYRQLISARNRHIPGGECPPGLIAPFWDDLIIPQNSGVYYWFDEENHRFIVQWSRVKRYGPNGNNEAEETFQVILHDPDHYPTFSGDGDIIFQYLDVTDARSCFQAWDTPFASVGIASPDLRSGIEYTYWGTEAAGADTLIDSTAIKFTTLVASEFGFLTGVVTDAATGQPIDSAWVVTKYGFATHTDENGEFRIDNMLVTDDYHVTAGKRFYNDSTLFDIAINVDEETHVEFALLHPEFSLSDETKDFIMLNDSIANVPIVLTNTGNGSLDFRSRYTYRIEGDEGRSLRGTGTTVPNRDDPDASWELLRRWNIGDSLQNGRVQAVVYVDTTWIVAAGVSAAADPNVFFILDREGTLINTIEQPRIFNEQDSTYTKIGGNFGFRDFEYQDGRLYAMASDAFLYELHPQTLEVLDQWTGINQLRSGRCVTRNPENGHFFLSGLSNDVYEAELVFVDSLQHEVLSQVTRFNPIDPRDGTTSIRRYGFAWFPDDPDGYSFYLIGTNEVPPDNPNHADVALFKIHPETREVRYLTDLGGAVAPADGGEGGIFITHKWSNRVYALAAMIEQDAHDWIGIFEIAPNSSWIDYGPKTGSLDAGMSVPIELEIASSDLELGDYQILLEYSHTASPGIHEIEINLTVTDTLPEENTSFDDKQLPLTFGLDAAYPNPFNQTTTIRFAIDQSALTKLRVYDLSGREVAVLHNGDLKAGRYRMQFGSTGLASGVYICRLESSGKTAVQKMILMK